jgi:hypothetical protein
MVDPFSATIQHDGNLTINSLHLLQLLDENSDERFIGNRSQRQNTGRDTIFFTDLNKSNIMEESTYTASSAEDVNATLLGVLTNVGHEDGRLIYRTEDDPSGNLTPNFRNKPIQRICRWAAIHGGKVFIKHPDGRCYLDDDDSTGYTISSTSGHIKSAVTELDVPHQINYVEVRGGIDPETGTPFSGTSEDTSAQTDGTEINRYFTRFRELQKNTDCQKRATQIRTGTGFEPSKITVNLRGVYGVPGQTVSFAYSPKSISATTYYIESVKYNLVKGMGTFVLNTGIFDHMSLSQPGYTFADETADDIAEILRATDYIYISPPLFPADGATVDEWGINCGANHEAAETHLYLEPNLDTDRNIIVRVITRNGTGGSRVFDGEIYIDGCDLSLAATNNIVNNASLDMVFIANGAYSVNTYTISASDLDDDYPVLYIRWRQSEGAVVIYVVAIQIQYYIKRNL